MSEINSASLIDGVPTLVSISSDHDNELDKSGLLTESERKAKLLFDEQHDQSGSNDWRLSDEQRAQIDQARAQVLSQRQANRDAPIHLDQANAAVQTNSKPQRRA